MDINFITDPSQAPQPRDRMKVVRINHQVYPDNRRVWLEVEVTPFMPGDRPNLSITVESADGKPVASMSVIETQLTLMSFTIHLRDHRPGDYQAMVSLYYDEPSGVVHSLSCPFVVPDISHTSPSDKLTD